MTNMKMLEMTTTIVDELARLTEMDGALNEMKRNPAFWQKSCLISPGLSAALELYESAVSKTAQEKIGAGAASAWSRLAKRVQKSNRFVDGDYGCMLERNGKWYLIDGAFVIRSDEKPGNVPAASMDDRLNGFADSFERNILQDNLFDSHVRADKITSPADLKQHIADVKSKCFNPKEWRRSDGAPYHVGGVSWVDPELLLDILAVMGDCEMYLPDEWCGNIYFKNETKRAVLAPVRHTEEASA